MPKGVVMLFAIPAIWLALLALAALLEQTRWGQEGHPSNSVILIIYLLLGAPLFGLAGCAIAWWRRRRYSRPVLTTAMLSNVVIIGAGLWFWTQV